MTKRLFFHLQNYTPHTICLYKDDNEILQEFPSHGNIKVLSKPQPPAPYDWRGIPVYNPEDKFEGLPDFSFFTLEEGIIVSPIAAQQLVTELGHRIPDQLHILAPDISPENVVRNSGGQIIGTKALIFYK